jgi:hypothetical protein
MLISGRVAMKDVVRFLTIAPTAAVAFLAAFMVQSTPVAAHPICGDTPVGVLFKVDEQWHAHWLARILWEDCARRKYGYEWAALDLARNKNDRPICYPGRTFGYTGERILKCPPRDNAHGRWVCFYRATPCRYPGR